MTFDKCRVLIYPDYSEIRVLFWFRARRHANPGRLYPDFSETRVYLRPEMISLPSVRAVGMARRVGGRRRAKPTRAAARETNKDTNGRWPIEDGSTPRAVGIKPRYSATV